MFPFNPYKSLTISYTDMAFYFVLHRFRSGISGDNI